MKIWKYYWDRYHVAHQDNTQGNFLLNDAVTEAFIIDWGAISDTFDEAKFGTSSK
jgi:hypothetical protein